MKILLCEVKLSTHRIVCKAVCGLCHLDISRRLLDTSNTVDIGRFEPHFLNPRLNLISIILIHLLGQVYGSDLRAGQKLIELVHYFSLPLRFLRTLKLPSHLWIFDRWPPLRIETRPLWINFRRLMVNLKLLNLLLIEVKVLDVERVLMCGLKLMWRVWTVLWHCRWF